jgi:hypothetical protein
VLISVRSTRSRRNWVVALVAVMDAAALQLAVTPSFPQGRARSVLRQGEQCLTAMLEVLGAPRPVPPPEGFPGAVDRADFDKAVARLRRAGVSFEVEPDEAWPVFRLWRDRYEGMAFLMCRRVDAVPSWWTGPRNPATDPVPTPEMGQVPVAGPASVERVTHHEYVGDPLARRQRKRPLRRRQRGNRGAGA